MEVIGAIASFIAIGQAAGAVPKIVESLKTIKNAPKEIADLVIELNSLTSLYGLIQENIDLFTGGQTPETLRVEEPSFLKQVRQDFEDFVADLKRVSDECSTKDGESPTSARLRWWKSKKRVVGLQDQCVKLTTRLQFVYTLFRDRYTYKQGAVVLEIYTQTRRLTLASSSTCSEPKTIADGIVLEDGDESATMLPNHVPNPNLPQPSVRPSFMNYTAPAANNRCTCRSYLSANTSQTRNGLVSLPGSALLLFRWTSTKGCQKCKAPRRENRPAFELQVQVQIRRFSSSMAAAFSFGPSCGIGISLRPQVIVPFHNALWEMIKYDRTEQLMMHLSESMLSVTDTTRGGLSLIQYMITHVAYESLDISVKRWHYLLKGTEEGRKAATEARYRLIRCEVSDYILSEVTKLALQRVIDAADEDNAPESMELLRIIGHPKRLEAALSQEPSMLRTADCLGNTPLHFACKLAATESVEILIRHGAELNARNHAGRTPLHVAINVWSGLSCAELLLDAGCDPITTDNLGITTLHDAVADSKNEFNRLVERLCLVEGPLPVGDTQATVLHALAETKLSDYGATKERLQALLDAGGGSLLEAMNSPRRTPLGEALDHDNTNIVRALLEAGSRVDVVNEDGTNALWYAAWTASAPTFRVLTRAGISCLDVRTTSGDKTPICLFRERQRFPERFFWCKILDTEDAEAFEELLTDIRGRALTLEIERLKCIISHIQAERHDDAREQLQKLVEKKVKDKIDHEEETFRAIDLYVRAGGFELAVESLKEFIEVSKDRMKVSPFDEEKDPWATESQSDSGNDDDNGSEVETLSSSDEGIDDGNDEDDEDGEDDDQGWETADEA